MGLLDFVKNRNAQQQSQEQTAQPKPETAREMYARQATQDAAAQRSIQQMPEAERARAVEAVSRLEKATRHIRQEAPVSTQAPADATASPQPMRQNMVAQDKAAPELSPTSAQRGQSSHEKNASAPSRESESQDQAKSAPARQQGRGGWER